MELVYLWVEEYKNIEKQGFHFNNRYIFEYNEDQNELKTKPTSKECLHIFPSNINITAIVGKNGSGKSALVGCLRNIFYYAKNDSYKLNLRYRVIF